MKPLSDVPIQNQARAMKQVRAAQNRIATSYKERDELMVAFAVSNSVSRHDMAAAAGLAKSRVDQIIRETYLRDATNQSRAAVARTKRHLRSDM